MGIIELILFGLGFFVLYGIFFGIPLSYIKIGKTIKKSSKYAMGIIGYLREKLFVNENVVERFTWFIEEFDNFILRGYSPSFTHMYSELSQKLRSKREREHILREIETIEREYRKIRDAEGLNRKGTFQEIVKRLKVVIEHTSEMAKDVVKLVEERTSDSEVSEELINNYRFTAREFNIFIRSFRNFLDRTHCYHNIEIKHYRLMNLLIPEEMLSKVM